MNSRTDKILSLSAIIIAVASIFISVWQGIESRNHNRLAVRPALDIVYSTVNKSFGFKVKNNGIGPAVLTKRTLLFKGKEIDWYNHKDLTAARESLQAMSGMNFSILRENSTIPVGEEYNLLLFSSDTLNGMTAKEKIFDSIGFKLEYQSMYGEIFIIESSNYQSLKN